MPVQSKIVAEIIRNDRVESVHRGHLAVVSADGEVLAQLGDIETRTYIRSAAKPFQVMPLISSGAADHFDFTDQELAVMMASHNGEGFHHQAVESILQKIGLSEEHLQCGSHAPLHEATARELVAKKMLITALHNNCSGKHAGMLAATVFQKWPLDSYLKPDHPLQVSIKETIAKFSNLPANEIGVGVDGCSAPVFYLPVLNMALMYARLAAGAIDPSHRVFDIMSKNPEMIAGSNRFDTDFMQALAGRAVSKIGAEGIRCVGFRGDKTFGVALKIEDGSKRASEAVLLEALAQLDWLTEPEIQSLEKYRRPIIKNHAGIETGYCAAISKLDIENTQNNS